MAQPLTRQTTEPPRIAPPMLIETRLYTEQLNRNDPEATTDSFDREELEALVEEMRSPNRVARDVIGFTWPHARVRRTELILDRRGFRKRWRKKRDGAVGDGDVATATLACCLVDAIDRMVPESLVVALCEVDGTNWEIFVDVQEERLLGCRSREDIW